MRITFDEATGGQITTAIRASEHVIDDPLEELISRLALAFNEMGDKSDQAAIRYRVWIESLLDHPVPQIGR